MKSGPNLIESGSGTNFPLEGRFDDHFLLREHLGKGAYGEVRKCVAISDVAEYAVKELNRSRMDDEAQEATEREIEISRDLRHPNIVYMHHCFRTSSSYRIVMELIHGGELFDAILQQDHYSEKDALICIKQVLEALNYCHQHNIMHRDLKPENLLLSRKMDKHESMQGVSIKLVDFGLAIQIPDGETRISTDTRGTPYCIAPETLRELKLGCPVDMWACGAVLYFMLIGMPPFWPEGGSQGTQQMFVRIVNGTYSFDGPEWKSISERTKGLVRKMLLVDQDKRVTAQASLKLVTTLINETKLNMLNGSGVLDRMRTFHHKHRRGHNTLLQVVAARRNVMERQRNEMRRRTPELFSSQSSGEEDPARDAPDRGIYTEDAEGRRRRKRSASMVESRENIMDGLFEDAQRVLKSAASSPRTSGEQPPMPSSQALVISSDSLNDDGKPSAYEIEVPQEFTRKRTVEEVGAAVLANERRNYRRSMLAELEPGNSRLWTHCRWTDDDSEIDGSVSLPSSNSETPLTSPHKSALPGAPSVGILREESEGSSSSSNSASASPECIRRPEASIIDSTSSGKSLADGVVTPRMKSGRR